MGLRPSRKELIHYVYTAMRQKYSELNRKVENQLSKIRRRQEVINGQRQQILLKLAKKSFGRNFKALEKAAAVLGATLKVEVQYADHDAKYWKLAIEFKGITPMTLTQFADHPALVKLNEEFDQLKLESEEAQQLRQTYCNISENYLMENVGVCVPAEAQELISEAADAIAKHLTNLAEAGRKQKLQPAALPAPIVEEVD